MPALTRNQSRAVDRFAVERFAMPSIVLMENAARAVADAAIEMLARQPRVWADQSILILCGGGNNGGDGLAAARHLHNHGCAVSIILLTDPGRYQGDALINWKIVQAMRLATWPWSHALPADKPALIIDAIFGTGLDKPPRPPFADVVQWMEQHGAPVLSVDVPSGLDCDTGQPLGVCIKATRTVTFVTEKIGYSQPSAKAYLGELTVADIGTPPEIVSMVLSENGGKQM